MTLRLRTDVPPITRDWLVQTIRSAIKHSQKVELHHVHLLTEASSAPVLSRGVRGFAGRLALRPNKKLKRTGTVVAERFVARALTSPRDVLLDRKHHDRSATFDRYWIEAPPMEQAQTWLLAIGWRKHGAIRFDERVGRS